MCKRGLVCVLLAAASALPSDPEGWGQQGPDDILVPIAPEKESRSYEKEWFPGKHLSRPGWFPGKAVDEEVVKMLPDGDRDGTPDSIDLYRVSPAAKHFMEHSALGMLIICTFEADEAVPGAARPRHVTRLTPLPLRLSCQPSPHSPSPLNHEWRVGPVAAAKEAAAAKPKGGVTSTDREWRKHNDSDCRTPRPTAQLEVSQVCTSRHGLSRRQHLLDPVGHRSLASGSIHHYPLCVGLLPQPKWLLQCHSKVLYVLVVLVVVVVVVLLCHRIYELEVQRFCRFH